MSSTTSRTREGALKRPIDILGAILGMILFAPLFLLIALAVWIDSPGPVLFKSERWGLHGRRIFIWKFRTMVHGAEGMLNGDKSLRAAFGTNVKLTNDPRLTRVGRWLRRWSLDEMPQFYNVLIGDLSLVGPRPKLVGEEEKYGEAWSTIISVRPGLTGLWQVSGRNTTTYQERVRLDMRYIALRSFWWDMLIVLRTIPTVFRGHGAY
jgi:lipopolysaccharide/colanic/teichoic acid biosynthesis glycosyltransferase